MNFSQFKDKYQKKKVVHYPHKVSTQPMVSIVVQTYQHKDFIRACLDSILDQKTNFPFEILVGEDASTDGTRNICIEYAKKYPGKIRLFLHHPDNKIKVLNTTTGNFNAFYNFFSAKGDFIAFCEGDDLWTDPLKLQKQVDLIKSNKELILTYHLYREVDQNEKPLSEAEILDQSEEEISKDDLKRLKFHPLLSTVCFRNSLENNIPEEMAEVINVDSFLLSYLGNFGEAGYLNNVSPTIYRRHQGGIWSGQIKALKLSSKILVFKKLAAFYGRTDDKVMRDFFLEKSRKAFRALIYYHFSNWNFKKIFNIYKNY